MIKNWIVIIVFCVTLSENHFQKVSIALGQKEGGKWQNLQGDSIGTILGGHGLSWIIN